MANNQQSCLWSKKAHFLQYGDHNILCILSTNKKYMCQANQMWKIPKKLPYKSPINSFFSFSLNFKVIHYLKLGCIARLICTKPFSFTNLVNAVFLRLTNCMFCNVLIVFLTKCITFSCTHTLLEKCISKNIHYQLENICLQCYEQNVQ